MNFSAFEPCQHIGEIEHDFFSHFDEWDFSSLGDPGVDGEDAESEICGELFFVEELSFWGRLGALTWRWLPVSVWVFHDAWSLLWGVLLFDSVR